MQHTIAFYNRLWHDVYMERHESFDPWDTGEADQWEAPKNQCWTCRRYVHEDLDNLECEQCACHHDRVTKSFANPGLDDEVRITCLTCGKVWDEFDYLEMLEARQSTRKPVASEHFSVRKEEVA